MTSTDFILIATGPKHTDRIIDALQAAGVAERFITTTDLSTEKEKNGTKKAPLCFIEYVIAADQPPITLADYYNSEPQVPHLQILARDIKHEIYSPPRQAIIFREPKKERGWSNIARCLNALTIQYRKISSSRASAKSSSFYHTLIDTVPAGIIQIDPMGIITGLNRWVVEHFAPDSRPEDLEGEKITESILSRKLNINHYVREVLQGMEISDSDLKTHPDGTPGEICLSVSGKPLFGALGEVIGGLLILEDVKDRRELEQKVAEFQTLETVGSLAGTLAHEFNSLLSLILAHTQYVSGRMDEQDPLRKDVNAIETASRTAAEIADKLCSLTRSNQSEVSLVNINQAVRDITTIMKRAFGERITISMELESSLKPIAADPIQIHITLLNILVNACEAMAQGGTIRIRTGAAVGPSLKVAGLKHAPHGAVWVAIQDNGVGMTPDVKSKAFRSFFTTKETNRHSGMGLAVVKKHLQQTLGAIIVDSQAGRGSTFTLYFPIVSAEQDIITDEPSGDTRGQELILLVEDELLIRSMSQKLLETGNFRVITAANGKEAIDLYHEHRLEIDLTIIDSYLPDMSWSKVVDKIRAIKPDARIMLASANATKTGLRDALQSYSLGFIQKPFRMKNLLEKVRTSLDQNSVSTS